MMQKQKILETRLVDIELTKLNILRVYEEWFMRFKYTDLTDSEKMEWRKNQWKEKVRDHFRPFFEALTINAIVDDYGELPLYYNGESGRTVFYQSSPMFCRFGDKLLEMGLTEEDWPMLAKNVKGIFAVHLRRAGYNKKKLKKCPAVVLGMSSGLLEGLGTFFRYYEMGEESSESIVIPWKDITIEYLLTLSPFDIQRLSNAQDIRHSLIATRMKLRELGFTDSDGQFISVGNVATIISRVAEQFNVSKQKAEEILDHFHWRGYEVLK